MSLLWYGVSPTGWQTSLHTDVQVDSLTFRAVERLLHHFVGIYPPRSVKDNVLIELVSPTNVYVFPRELFLSTPPDVNITGEYHKIRPQSLKIFPCGKRQDAVPLITFGQARTRTGSRHPQQLPPHGRAPTGLPQFGHVRCGRVLDLSRTIAWL